MRLVDAHDYHLYSSIGGLVGGKMLESASTVITYDEAALQSSAQNVSDLSSQTALEQQCFIVLDRESGIISSIPGPAGTNNRAQIDVIPAPHTGINFLDKPGGLVLIGQMHGHPASNQENTRTASSISSLDQDTARRLAIPIMAIDAMGSSPGRPQAVHLATPDGNGFNNIGKTVGTGRYSVPASIDIGRLFMETWGKR